MIPGWSGRRAALATGAASYTWNLPPIFAGATSAVAGDGTITVAWTQATDDVTPHGSITYRVYVATTPGGQNLAAAYASVVGASSIGVTGLANGTVYYLVVRAVDGAGNEDDNIVEVSAAPVSSGRLIRARRRAGDGSVGTLNVSSADAARQPFRLRTKKE